MCTEGITSCLECVTGIADPPVYMDHLANVLMHSKITGWDHHLSEVAL